MGARLPRGFFDRPATEVAPDLLGCVLVRTPAEGVELRARIVETEAYEPDDPASHSFRGRTERNRSMFGPPGQLYVYFTYGMHHCMNVVARRRGLGAAVLLRAGEPVSGIEAMEANRGTGVVRDLCRGPGRWAQAFDVDRRLDGADLVRGRAIWLERGDPPEVIARGPRRGLSRATTAPWRYAVAESPFVSSPRVAITDRPRSATRP